MAGEALAFLPSAALGYKPAAASRNVRMPPIHSWRRPASRLAALALAWLGACSMFPKLATLDQARASLTGMSESQVTACLGVPGTRRTAGDGTAVWTYTQGLNAMRSPQPVSDPSQASFGYSPFAGPVGSPSMAAAVAPPPPASCMLVLTFGNGLVADVMYSAPGGGPPAQPEACGALAGRCLP